MAANTIGPQSPYLNAIRDPGYAAKRDRRKRVRTSVHWPVVFRSPANEVFETITQNLSSQGFYCLSSTPLASGQPLLCWVTVPTYDPTGGMSSVVLECDVQVVRSEAASADGLYGFACRIKEYRFGSAAPGFHHPLPDSETDNE